MKKHFFALLGLTFTFFAGAFIGQAAGYNPALAGTLIASLSASKYLIGLVMPHTLISGMALGAIDITELASKLGAYDRENRDILVTEMLLDDSFTDGLTVYDDVNDELPLPNLSITDVIQPGTNKNFTPIDNAVKVGARILKVRDVKVDLLLEPWKLEKTWLGSLKKNKQDPFEFPFEKFIMDYINSKVRENLRLKGIYKGVYNAAGNSPIDTMDGWLKIVANEIAADHIDPVITGAITNANVIDKVESVYDALGEVYKNKETVMKASPTIFDWYVRAYRAQYGKNLDYKGMARNQVYIDGSMCALEREPGLSGSQRLLCTVEENFAYGVSSSSGYNIDIQKFDRTLKILIDFKAGVELHQIVSNAFATNDQL